MRLSKLAVHGLLSFDDFTTEFRDGVSVIVGPNGAGKSNIGRVFDLLLAALRTADRPSNADQELLNLHSLAAVTDPLRDRIEVRAQVHFTGSAEHELLHAFLQGCVASAIVGSASGIDTTATDAWVAAHVTAEQVHSLTQGTIVLSHPGTADGGWRIGYEFEVVNTQPGRFHWVLRSNMSSADFILGIDDAGRSGVMGQALADKLYPNTNASTRGPSAGGRIPAAPFTFATLLPERAHGVTCAFDLNSSPMPAAVRTFTQLLGIGDDTNRHYGFAAVLSRLLSAALTRVSEDGLRLGGTRTGDGREGLSPSDFALRLLYLKNGPSATRTHFDAVCHRFATFTNGRQVDVVLPVRSDASATVPDVEPRVVVSLDPVPVGERTAVRQVPMEFAGSGAREALALALALAATPDAIVVLDEPAAGLHPSMQRRLATEVLNSPAQVVLITHSPYIVPYDPGRTRPQLMRFVREPGSSTRAHIVPPDNLDVAMARAASNGNEGLPFAAKAILCEGKTDVAAVRALATRLKLDLEAANIAVVDCDSRNNQPGYIRFAANLRLPALVISDGDGSKAGKPEVRDQVAAVVAAARAGDAIELVLFDEDFETALAIPKSKRHPMAETIAQLDLSSRPEVVKLVATLQAFCK